MSSFGVFMSYCRQENTYRAICEAIDQIEEYQNDPEMDMSDSEVRAFKNSIEKIVDWLYDMCILDGQGELDKEELDEICLKLKGEWYRGDE